MSLPFTRLARALHPPWFARVLYSASLPEPCLRHRVHLLREVPTPSLFEEHKTPTNTRAFHSKHLLLTSDSPEDPATWPRKLELAPGTFNQEFTRYKRKMLHPEYPVLVTSTNLTPPLPDKAQEAHKAKNVASGYLFPDGRYFRDIDINKTPEFIKQHLVPKEAGEVDGDITESLSELFPSEPMDHSLILICWPSPA